MLFPGSLIASSRLCVMDVCATPQLLDIHTTYGPILRLANLDSSPDLRSCGSSSDEAFASDDGWHRHSPAISPTTTQEAKLAELTSAEFVYVPPSVLVPDQEDAMEFVRRCQLQDSWEKSYIAFVFLEYKKRKAVAQKWKNGLDAMRAELAKLWQLELPPAVRAAVDEMKQVEETARGTIAASYDKFLDWIAEVTPQWLEAVEKRVADRKRHEEARRAVMAAAREELTRELTGGKQLNSGLHSGAGAGDMSSATMGSTVDVAVPSVKEVASSYMPELLPVQGNSTGDVVEPSSTELYTRAIQMLENEATEISRRTQMQAERLREQEEELRRRISEKEAAKEEVARAERERQMEEMRRQEEELRRRIAEKETAKEVMANNERARRMEEVCRQEEELRRRITQKEAADEMARTERERQMEEMRRQEEELRRRIAEKETAKDEMARAEKERRMNEMRRQEEELRQRIAKREAAAESERRQLAEQREREMTALMEKQRREAAFEELRKEQEEALNRARETQDQIEKQRQLIYLKEQEAAYKRRLREREIAEIESKRIAATTSWPSPVPIPYPAPQSYPVSSQSFYPPGGYPASMGVVATGGYQPFCPHAIAPQQTTYHTSNPAMSPPLQVGGYPYAAYGPAGGAPLMAQPSYPTASVPPYQGSGLHGTPPVSYAYMGGSGR